MMIESTRSMFPFRYYLLLFLLNRFSSLLLVRTWFVPDEYWQSLEVAHHLIFGYGYLTWEWQENIRSYVYPSLMALLYKLLSVCALDYPIALTVLPRILQGAVFGVGDYFAYRLSMRIHGPVAARWTAFSIATSWFLHYTSTRTLTNTAEASVSTIALFFYPWSQFRQIHLTTYLWFASLAFVLRPTAAVLWIPMVLWHFFRTPFKIKLIKKAFVVGIASLAAMVACDRLCSGHWTFSPYNFLYFNWSHNIGAFYGSHPWHWYASQGLPTILSVHVVPFLAGIREKRLLPLYGIVAWVVFVLSFLSHKEFRFLLPVMHPIMCICGATLASFATTRRRRILSALGLVLCNVPLVIYFGMVHQRGALRAVDYLAEQTANATSETRILFLMPCHSMPFYSHIHRNVSMRFLTCEPNLRGQNDYVDEADYFYGNPEKWLAENVVHPYPTHVVVFDVLEPKITGFLSGYGTCHQAFHTHFPEGRVGQFIKVFCNPALGIT